MSGTCTSNVTSGFIDLATYDEIEKYMYGGPDATAYFVRETRKATWFTQVPVVLSRASGTPAFGQEWSVSISRAGDYLLQTWLRVAIPEIRSRSYGVNNRNRDENYRNGEFADMNGSHYPSEQKVYIKWTRNLMHNLIRECCITFNDLVAARFDSYHLDFWTAFTVPAGKQNGYKNMIGDIPPLTTPSERLPLTVLNLPLPFFFTRDSGVALPTAALPYNDMRICFNFRDWRELLTTYVVNTANGSTNLVLPRVAHENDFMAGGPNIGTTQVWANYAIVSNDERKRMACAPRDILIEQVQTAPRQTFVPRQNSTPQFDVRFSHAIKVIFFAARNTTIQSEWSNYKTVPMVAVTEAGNCHPTVFETEDPIFQTSLIYENTNRLAQMGSDFFSLVEPYYAAVAIPEETGYHMYSYSLDFVSLDPMGSTNYGKLTNVSIAPEASLNARDASNGSAYWQFPRSIYPDWNGGNVAWPTQTYEFITTVVNNNIIRISGGALGFPVL